MTDLTPICETKPTWTDSRVARLKALWMEGLSANQIAKELGGGVTKNAVIGKIHRLKLPERMRKPPKSNVLAKADKGRNGRAGKDRGAHERASKARQARIKTSPLTGLIQPGTPVEPKPIVSRGEPPLAFGVGILDLDSPSSPHMCRYIYGDPKGEYSYCGKDTDGGPWCEAHRVVVWTKGTRYD